RLEGGGDEVGQLLAGQRDGNAGAAVVVVVAEAIVELEQQRGQAGLDGPRAEHVDLVVQHADVLLDGGDEVEGEPGTVLDRRQRRLAWDVDDRRRGRRHDRGRGVRRAPQHGRVAGGARS